MADTLIGFGTHGGADPGADETYPFGH